MTACRPEGCSGRIEAVLAKRSDGGRSADDGALLCLDEQGTVVADYGLVADYGQRGIGSLALSRLDQDRPFLIDVGYGISVPALNDDLTLTDAVFTMPERLRTPLLPYSSAVPQEWPAARVLRHASGPILVDYRPDGDVAVWRLARGFLPLLQSQETEAPSPGGGFFVLPPDDTEGPPQAFFEDYADGPDSVAISAFPAGEPTVKIPRSAEPLLVASTSQSTYLVLMADGSAFSVDLAAEGASVAMDLTVSSGIRTADYRQRMLAVGSEDGVTVFAVEAGSEQPIRVLESGALKVPFARRACPPMHTRLASCYVRMMDPGRFSQSMSRPATRSWGDSPSPTRLRALCP